LAAVRIASSGGSGTSLRARQGFAVIGFEQDHPLSVAQDESGTTIGSLPFDAIAAVFGDGGLTGGLAFL
jgi:hypothetical protein